MEKCIAVVRRVHCERCSLNRFLFFQIETIFKKYVKSVLSGHELPYNPYPTLARKIRVYAERKTHDILFLEDVDNLSSEYSWNISTECIYRSEASASEFWERYDGIMASG